MIFIMSQSLTSLVAYMYMCMFVIIFIFILEDR